MSYGFLILDIVHIFDCATYADPMTWSGDIIMSPWTKTEPSSSMFSSMENAEPDRTQTL